MTADSVRVLIMLTLAGLGIDTVPPTPGGWAAYTLPGIVSPETWDDTTGFRAWYDSTAWPEPVDTLRASLPVADRDAGTVLVWHDYSEPAGPCYFGKVVRVDTLWDGLITCSGTVPPCCHPRVRETDDHGRTRIKVVCPLDVMPDVHLEGCWP